MIIVLIAHYPLVSIVLFILFLYWITAMSKDANKPAKKVKPTIKPIAKNKPYQPEVINPRRYNSL